MARLDIPHELARPHAPARINAQARRQGLGQQGARRRLVTFRLAQAQSRVGDVGPPGPEIVDERRQRPHVGAGVLVVRLVVLAFWIEYLRGGERGRPMHARHARARREQPRAPRRPQVHESDPDGLRGAVGALGQLDEDVSQVQVAVDDAHAFENRQRAQGAAQQREQRLGGGHAADGP